jgi:hypothetical protein
MVAVAFMPFMPKEEIIAALRTRMTAIEAMIEALEYQARQPADEHRPPHVAELLRLMAKRAAVEIDWSQGIIAMVEQGDLPFGKSGYWAERHGDSQ